MPDPLQVKRVVKTLGMVNVEPAAINHLECVQVLVALQTQWCTDWTKYMGEKVRKAHSNIVFEVNGSTLTLFLEFKTGSDIIFF